MFFSVELKEVSCLPHQLKWPVISWTNYGATGVSVKEPGKDRKLLRVNCEILKDVYIQQQILQGDKVRIGKYIDNNKILLDPSLLIWSEQKVVKIIRHQLYGILKSLLAIYKYKHFKEFGWQCFLEFYVFFCHEN